MSQEEQEELQEVVKNNSSMIITTLPDKSGVTTMLVKSTAKVGAEGDKPGDVPRLALTDESPTDADKKKAQENNVEIFQKLIDVRERQFMDLAEKGSRSFPRKTTGSSFTAGYKKTKYKRDNSRTLR